MCCPRTNSGSLEFASNQELRGTYERRGLTWETVVLNGILRYILKNSASGIKDVALESGPGKRKNEGKRPVKRNEQTSATVQMKTTVKTVGVSRSTSVRIEGGRLGRPKWLNSGHSIEKTACGRDHASSKSVIHHCSDKP